MAKQTKCTRQPFHTHHFFKNSAFLLSGILIGASMFLLTQASYTVQTNIDNAVQVIKRIVLQQSDGITTGSVLSGDTINTVHMQATEYCDENGDDCVVVTDLLSGYTETDPAFLAHSGDYFTTGQSDARYLGQGGGVSLWNTGASDSINYMSGNVGIGTSTPNVNLQVSGILIAGESPNGDYLEVRPGDQMLLNSTHDIILGDTEGFGNNTSFTVSDTNQKFIFDNGNVGIGLTNPSTKLQVDGTARFNIPDATNAFQIYDGNNGTAPIQIDTTNKEIIFDNAGDGYKFSIGLGGPATHTLDVSGDAAIDGDLDVSGLLMVAGYPSTTNPCDGTNEGAIFYDTTNNYHCACDAGGTAHTLHDYQTQCR